MTLISDNQPSEILKPGKEPFNLPAAFMPPKFPPVLSFWSCPVAAVRGNQLNTMLFQKVFIELIAVIRFVANKFLRHFLEEEAVKRGFGQFHLMLRSTRKAGGDRKTGSVRNGHDPAPFAPFCPADRIAPFLAGTKLPSMNASRRSTPPRFCKSAASSSIISRNTPLLLHSWKRRWHV